MAYSPQFQNRTVIFEDWGHADYKTAWDRQKQYQQQIVAQKVANRKRPPLEHVPTDNYLVFNQHPHVFTLGKSGDEANLLLSEAEMAAAGIQYYHIERGGDITYHGPGQLTGYPIFDLENFRTDLGSYLRNIEQAIINVLASYGIKGDRIEKLTGVWVDTQTPNPRKICAIGIKCSRWVSMHGFAFNITTDLSYFNKIVPCGIADKGVTSLAAELGEAVDFNRVADEVKIALSEVFGYRYAHEGQFKPV